MCRPICSLDLILLNITDIFKNSLKLTVLTAYPITVLSITVTRMIILNSTLSYPVQDMI